MKNNEIVKVACDLSNKPWLNTEEACIYTTFGADTLREARDMRKLAYHIKERKIVYKRTDLDVWLSNLEYHPLNGRIQNVNKK